MSAVRWKYNRFRRFAAIGTERKSEPMQIISKQPHSKPASARRAKIHIKLRLRPRKAFVGQANAKYSHVHTFAHTSKEVSR